MRAGVPVVMLAACGRIDFEPIGEPVCSWSPEPVFAATPVPVLAVDTPGAESDPTLSHDGLELFVGGNGAIRRAVRATRADDFVPMGGVPGLENVTGDLGGFSLSRDGLTGYFARMLAGQSDLYVTTRPDVRTPFGSAQLIAELATPGHEFNPRVSADDLTIVFVRWADNTDANTADAFFAHRPTVGSPWRDIARAPYATALTDAASSFVDANTVVFESDRDLFFVHRRDEVSPFGAAVPLAINTSAFDGLPFVSSDGCELFFVSDRGEGSGGLDIYRAEITAR